VLTRMDVVNILPNEFQDEYIKWPIHDTSRFLTQPIDLRRDVIKEKHHQVGRGARRARREALILPEVHASPRRI
jgi:hypothetical protein